MSQNDYDAITSAVTEAIRSLLPEIRQEIVMALQQQESHKQIEKEYNY